MTRCLKCGAEAPEGHSFCEACASAMRQYPIPPGTPVMLPHRPAPASKAARRKRSSQAETIRKLYKQLRLVIGLCILFGALTAVLSVLLILSWC